MQHPKISIVTPVYNGVKFIEQTLLSVLNQNYPNLEYIVVDGGSTDGTVDIIRQYEHRLTDWVSEPDSGMYDALEKGFRKTTGDIMGWVNADDIYCDWTLGLLGELFTQFEQVKWLTSGYPSTIDHTGKLTRMFSIAGYSRTAYYRAEHLPAPSRQFKLLQIMQESTFWRRGLWQTCGSQFDTSLRYAGDADLWLRFFNHAELYTVQVPLARFRLHAEQLSTVAHADAVRELNHLIERHHVKPHNMVTAFLREMMREYTPPRLKRLPYLLGLMHQCSAIQYSPERKEWELRKNYY